MRERALLLSCLLLTASTPAETQPRMRPTALLGNSQPPATAVAADAFFDTSALHAIRLDLNAKDWLALQESYLANTYYPADFRWGSEVVRNVGIRSRGTSSRSGVKPGLRVDFDRYDSSQTFLGLRSIVLRNNLTDESNLHDRLGLLFFRRMGVPASREAQATLYVNGAYAGLYSTVESVDKLFLARSLGENEGHLYKFDRNVSDPPYYLEDRGPDAARYVPHPFKPETHESDPQPGPIADLVGMVANLSDGTFRAAVEEYIDLAAFVKHVAIESFIAETDGLVGDSGMNNFYLYRLNGQRLHVVIPWDKTEAMRNGPTQPITHGIDDVSDDMRNRLMNRVWKYNDLRNLYLDTLLACAAAADEPSPGDGRGWLEREVEHAFEQIRDAVVADTAKPSTNEQFLEAIEGLRRFARERGRFVVSEVQKLRPTP